MSTFGNKKPAPTTVIPNCESRWCFETNRIPSGLKRVVVHVLLSLSRIPLSPPPSGDGAWVKGKPRGVWRGDSSPQADPESALYLISD